MLDEALVALQDAGAVIVDEVGLPDQRGLAAAFDVLLYEFKANLNAYLEGLGPGAPLGSLEDAIRFNQDNREREMQYFGQDIFLAAQEQGPLTERPYRDALARVQRLAGAEGIDAAMDRHSVDALVAPTGGPAWVTDLTDGDHVDGSSSSPAARAGYPNISVPAGFVMGLPVGVSFFGRRWSEVTLLRIAYAFEQVSMVRRSPGFRTRDDLTAAV